ncbi:MAG: chlorophyll synthesis pathway protein BchC [Pseudomonadota bacterium]
MQTEAIVLTAPRQLAVERLSLVKLAPGDVLIDVEWCGVSSGTERLLWSGEMPPFPGMGYPLVPGYESVGRVIALGDKVEKSDLRIGDRVFAPGSYSFEDAFCLFGGAARRLVVAAEKVRKIPDGLGQEGVLLALAATAHHALKRGGIPDLIVGHGVLGRLLARLVQAHGATPVVWERENCRRTGNFAYPLRTAETDPEAKYKVICDVSGDPKILDVLTRRLHRGGRVVLAGFYAAPVQFLFPPAFMAEAEFRIAAEWTPGDMDMVLSLIDAGKLSLDGLITHSAPPKQAESAYATAFEDAECLKMVIDWRDAA